MINGEKIAYISDGDLEQYLENYKNSFKIKGQKCQTSFVDDIEIKTDYFVTKNVLSLESAKSIIDNIKVKTTTVEVVEDYISYTTTTEYTDTKLLGYSKITTPGVLGKKECVDDVIYINGKEVSRITQSSRVLSYPIPQVRLVGTAKSLASSQQRAEAYSSGFIFPIDKNVKWSVSAYWGDGRNHKAIDLACPRGTKIYAVANGTVTYAGFKSDYGYFVTIDHGNGITTAYAHASALGVKKGDRVVAGETIALVGSTGWSTGNHLHFEVRKNGTRIDPAPYIGLDK